MFVVGRGWGWRNEAPRAWTCCAGFVDAMGSASDRYIGGAASVHRRCRSAPMHRRYNQLDISGQLGCSLSP